MKKITLFALFIFIGAMASVYLVGAAEGGAEQTLNALPNTTASSSPSGTDPGLTLAVVATHATPTDCYLVINKKVYDVSRFIGQHPGGARNITSRCGKEVTGIFASIHSNFAWDLLSNYYIGDVSSGQSAPADSSGTADTSVRTTLGDLEQALKKSYPEAEIISINPKQDFYVANMIKENKLFEVRLDSSGNILKLEVKNDEFDWDTRDHDEDERDD